MADLVQKFLFVLILLPDVSAFLYVAVFIDDSARFSGCEKVRQGELKVFIRGLHRSLAQSLLS